MAKIGFMRFLPGYISVAFFLCIPVEAKLASTGFLGDFSSRKKCELCSSGSDQTFLSKKYLAFKDSHESVLALDQIGQINQISQGLQRAPFVELQIRSDSQSWENENLFVAEGNVEVVLHGGSLTADRIEIDKSKNIAFASGNVYFRNGKTLLSASSFRYNLEAKKGKLENVYGVIDIKLIAKDLNLQERIDINDSSSIDKGKDLLRDVKFVDGFIFQGGFDQNMEMIKHRKNKKNYINKWRIKASEIFFAKDSLTANKVSFTNDPFQPAQIRIDSRKVEIRFNEGKLEDGIIIAEKSHLTFEDKFKLPIGNRKLRLDEKWKVRKWTIGIDGNDKDGVFIGRQLKPIILNDNYILSLQPQYLIQRSIQGETSSYPADGSSVNSKKVSEPAKFEDLFGLEVELQGKLFNWDSNISGDISTLNSKRFENGSRFSAEITRKLDISKFKDFDFSLFGLYRDEVLNGSIGSTDIYTAYGLNLSRKGSWQSGKTRYEDELSSGMAKYQADKLKSTELISLWRSNLVYDLDVKYPLKEFGKKELQEYQKSPYSPKSIYPGLYLNSILTASNFIYESNSSQSFVTVGLGPELTFGNLKRNYLDYTKLSILPSYTFISGKSPFKFDNENDLIKLKIDLAQQLAGPLLARSVQEFNIDKNSDNYGKSITSKFSVMWQRRAYEFGLFYDFENDSGGLSFRLNGFDYNGMPDSF